MSLSVLFMGTPEFALRALEAIHRSHHRVVGVVSQPDRPKGRGQALVPPPVAAFARAEGLPLLQPERCNDAAFRQHLRAFGADIAVVAAFGHILGPKALAVPRLGCVNIHASLLPRHRGASPISAAIDAGDSETGVAIMQMDPGMDTGPVFTMASLPIAPDDTTPSLHDKLAALGASLIVDALDGIEAGTLTATPQPAEGTTYAAKLDKAMADLDWSEPADALSRHIRAQQPWPGARASVGGRLVRLHPPVRVADGWRHDAATGEVLTIGPEGVRVACGSGSVLTLSTLQAEGRRALPAAEFARGFGLEPGMRFERPLST
jgi:methionyl-tRNA formyltransferase